MADINKTIDDFIDFVNSNEIEPGFENEIPPSLRTEIVDGVWFKWKIKAHDNINWIKEIEGVTKLPFPRSYKSLVSRYIFPCFDLGPISFLGNIPTGSNFDQQELLTGIFTDTNLSNCLLKNGYLQFGRSSTGSYDPICFDTNRVTNKREYAIFRIDHERALIDSKISIVEKIAPSFINFVKNYNKNNH
ncbi:MAG TPA: hypothetical protein ENJ41_01025 [Oceanospirillales bacterium]|nr:hypothetical protein [Oceanospirillales bacterium]